MDPVSAIGLAASLAQLVGTVAKIISYINDVKNASKERILVNQEAASLLGLLTTLQFKVEDANPTESWYIHVRSLGGTGGPLEQFERRLEKLAKKLRPDSTVKNLGRKFIWTLDKNEVKELLDAIERLKTLISIALQEDNFRLSLAIRDDVAKLDDNIGSISDGIKKVHLHQELDARRKLENDRQIVIDWLCPLNFASKQMDILTQRVEGTGQWLLEHQDFQVWRDGGNRAIGLPGIPGAGKTVLTAIVADHLKHVFSSTENVAVSCLYHSYKEQGNQTTANLTASILQQVIQQKAEVSDETIALYKRNTAQRTRPAVHELIELLCKELRGFSKAFILVDAMDECAEANGVRDSFLALLQGLVKEPNVRLMITSRPLTVVKTVFSSITEIEIQASDGDLRLFLETRVLDKPRLAPLVKADPVLKDRIIKTLISKAAGMFLMASLHLDSLAAKHNKKGVLNALDVLPQQLNDTYEEAMDRIRRQGEEDSLLAKRILVWISYALRPLAVGELKYALTIEPETKAIDEDLIIDEDLLISVCAGLVTIDHESGIVRLVHYTAQEYLSSHRTLLLPMAEVDVVISCLTYLLFENLMETERECKNNRMPLVRSRYSEVGQFPYAVKYWVFHARGALEQDPVIQSLILKLLNDIRGIADCLRYLPSSLLLKINPVCYEDENRLGFKPLHAAACLNLPTIVEVLLERGAPIDQGGTENPQYTALQWAATAGCDCVIELLLKRGAKVDRLDAFGNTALHAYVVTGHDRLVGFFCESGAAIDARNRSGKTPLMLAILCGNKSAVAELIRRGADIEQRWRISWRAWTPLDLAWSPLDLAWSPLDLAIQLRDMEMVLLLIAFGVDLQRQGVKGVAPIHHAILESSVEIVKVLLDHGVFVDERDSGGFTALYRVVERANRDLVHLLLKEGANVNSHSETGWTALHSAAGNARWHSEHLVMFLLKHGADHSVVDFRGVTPLHCAATTGRLSVLRLLLDAGANINASTVENPSGSWQGTALQCAKRKGNKRAVKILIEAGAKIELEEEEKIPETVGL